ncbi:hypothetical protein [Polynucleobacter sp.]|uniref:hypothetical protein n=1 Tax=Polynucleobacter sp. TaxID=2029855 RepID=UPI00258FC99F|nr:hypothetical protein [Polynucleobacter sp.]MCX7237134.1 hypothetical protein [Polynucleobacter sp.]
MTSKQLPEAPAKIRLSPEFERAVLYGSLEELIEDALGGNKISANEVLIVAMRFLHPNLADVEIDSLARMPKALRKYLFDALERIVRGESADVALNFKKPGKPDWGFMAKRLGAYLVYQALTESQCSVETASDEAAEFIQDQAHHGLLQGHWRCFQGKDLPKGAAFRNWYYQEKEYLEKLHLQYP